MRGQPLTAACLPGENQQPGDEAEAKLLNHVNARRRGGVLETWCLLKSCMQKVDMAQDLCAHLSQAKVLLDRSSAAAETYHSSLQHLRLDSSAGWRS